jgi:hypothetical protein
VIDCSGWVGLLLSSAMKAQNVDAGKDIFDAADIAACIAWSDRIIMEIEARTSTPLVGSDITAATLPRNATIGLDIGDFSWTTNFPRARGINHIVQVVRRPTDQIPFVSESIGPDNKGGVRLRRSPLGFATSTAISLLAKHGRSTRSPWPTAMSARAVALAITGVDLPPGVAMAMAPRDRAPR